MEITNIELKNKEIKEFKDFVKMISKVFINKYVNDCNITDISYIENLNLEKVQNDIQSFIENFKEWNKNDYKLLSSLVSNNSNNEVFNDLIANNDDMNIITLSNVDGFEYNYYLEKFIHENEEIQLPYDTEKIFNKLINLYPEKECKYSYYLDYPLDDNSTVTSYIDMERASIGILVAQSKTIDKIFNTIKDKDSLECILKLYNHILNSFDYRLCINYIRPSKKEEVIKHIKKNDKYNYSLYCLTSDHTGDMWYTDKINMRFLAFTITNYVISSLINKIIDNINKENKCLKCKK